MKKIKLFVFFITISFLMVSTSFAISFNFEGNSGGFTYGTAWMELLIAGNTVTADLKNTSPTEVDGTTNTPAITGFGFDVSNDPLPLLNDWQLWAHDSSMNWIQIGGKGFVGEWGLLEDGNYNGIKVDYTSKIQNVQGGLYNPDASTGFAAAPNYFTLAKLTLEFDSEPMFDFSNDYSPFVRMQNVGPDGKLSLKMGGSESETPPPPVPEPGTMVLLGFGLIGIAAIRGRLFKK